VTTTATVTAAAGREVVLPLLNELPLQVENDHQIIITINQQIIYKMVSNNLNNK